MFGKGLVVWSRVLDGLFTGIACCYSTRLLITTYGGYAINVRRSSDNATTDVRFDSSGSISASSIVSAGGAFSTWYGSSNVFVTKWYDQSGNGNDASQATTANQPQIVTSGVINRINGQTTLHFNGSQVLSAPNSSSISLDSTLSCLVVVSFDNFTTIRAIYDKRGPSPNYTGTHFYSSASADVNFQWNTTSMSSVTKAASLSTSTLYSLSVYATKNSSADFWKKTTDLGSASLAASGSSTNTNPLLIGGHVDTPTFQIVGSISEFMLFNNVLTTTQRNLIINNQAAYFSL